MIRAKVRLGPKEAWGRPGPRAAAPRTAGAASLPAELYNETMAQSLLEFHERTAQIVWNQFAEATWNYVTNITNKNLEEMVWYRFHSSPYPSLVSGLSGGGDPTLSVPCPQLEEKRDTPKFMSKQVASSVPLGGATRSPGQTLL